jgi:hypothetical protein
MGLVEGKHSLLSLRARTANPCALSDRNAVHRSQSVDQKSTSASVIFFRELGSAGGHTGMLVLLCFALASHLHALIRVKYFFGSYCLSQESYLGITSSIDLGGVVRVVDICVELHCCWPQQTTEQCGDCDKTDESMRLNYDCPRSISLAGC